MWQHKDRIRRRHELVIEDQRDQFQRDRDRILYSSAFHRLSGVTQIVRAGEEDVFHNRQQHSIKVAQIGRRLSERLIVEFPSEAKLHDLNPEVVEAASLAHDIGHPPFGHAGEEILNNLVLRYGSGEDGYEGNAQTFRVLCKLSIRHDEEFGLDLTRATLASVLKYPWLREKDTVKKSVKWSAYRTEKNDFDFAREYFSHEYKSAEAELMDLADDIAYSVHDLEDFHRCNAVPWSEIFSRSGTEKLVENTRKQWFDAPVDAKGRLRKAMSNLARLYSFYADVFSQNYVGTREQRHALRNFTSVLIGRFVKAPKLLTGEETVELNMNTQCEILLLKQITRDFIFSNPALIAQQEGQKTIINELYNRIYCAAKDNKIPEFLPHRLRFLHEISSSENGGKADRARFAADCIASLTENEVIKLYNRLFGSSSGSVLHPIVR